MFSKLLKEENAIDFDSFGEQLEALLKISDKHNRKQADNWDRAIKSMFSDPKINPVVEKLELPWLDLSHKDKMALVVIDE